MWARFDDHYYTNPKVLGVGRDGIDLHQASVIWVAGNAPMVGRIPKTALRVLGLLAQMPAQSLKPAADRLVKARLWEDEDDHWLLHDHWVYLPKDMLTADQRREAHARAGRLGGLATASKLAAIVEQQQLQPIYSDVPASSQQNGSESQQLPAIAASNSQQAPGANPSPVPSRPVPLESLNVKLSVNEAQRIFELWRTSTGKLAAKLLPQRVRMMEQRIREGYSVDDLCDAVRGHVNDPWEGRKDELDLKYLIGDGSRVEKFASLYRTGRPAPAMTKPGGATERAQTWHNLADRLRNQPKELQENG